MRRQRDIAIQERDFARNESDCLTIENQNAERRIQQLEQALATRDSLIQRLSEETGTMGDKIERMAAER